MLNTCPTPCARIHSSSTTTYKHKTKHTIMFASAVLTTLIAAGTAHAAVAQGDWGVRADFSRKLFHRTESCHNAEQQISELDGIC